jgi:Flp pilus assembly protein TadD
VELVAGLERWEEAVASARELVRLTPEDPLAHQVVGTCLERVERYEEALGAYERASELAPESVESKLHLLVCLLRLGRDEEYKERLRELIGQHPGNGELRAMLAMTLQTEGNFEQAGRWYQEAHNLEPEKRVFESLAKIFREPVATRPRKKRKRRRPRR